MKLTVTHFFKGLLAAILLLLTTAPVAAQDSCTFRLRIYDYYGDTWDDSYVYVRFGNNPERGFTHTGAGRRADSVFFYNLRVRTGDSIFIRYQIAQDLYQNEAQYTLYDNVGEVIFQDGDGPNLGIPPRAGSVYKGVAKCRNCGIPINPVINEIRTFTATARWRPASQGFQPTYFVEWDTAGFRRGRGRNKLNTTDTFAVLNNLTELVKYDAYIGTVCFGNDSSTVIGPIAFLTDTASDVGITRIITPIGRCDLGVDSVKIVMTNIGGAPQQLIPFKYSVNGVLAPVQQPADGLYTGVLSKDSSVTIAFKALSDFSAIGEYEIKAWTDLSGDKNRKNDTTRILITHPRTIATYPYAQDFEAGKDTWSVIDSIGNSTWQYGTPRWKTIKGAASGTKAWTTWADSSYRDGDLGYVQIGRAHV